MSYFFSNCSCFSCNLLAKCEVCDFGDVTPLLAPPLRPPRGLVSDRSVHACPLMCSDLKHCITAPSVQVPHPVLSICLYCTVLCVVPRFAFTWSYPRQQIYWTLPPRRSTPALLWVPIAVPVFAHLAMVINAEPMSMGHPGQ